MKRSLSATAWLGVVLFVACGESGPSPIETCAATSDGGVPASLDLAAFPERASQAGEAVEVSLPLEILAAVPCLRGGMHAYISTSLGSVGGAAPGSKATIYLAPTEAPGGALVLVGETPLKGPPGRSARIVVEVLDTSVVRTFTLPVIATGGG